MPFKMNNRNWEIKEVSQEKLCELEGESPSDGGNYFGLCCYDTQTIYLWENLHSQQKRETLMHELMHCYIGCYLSFEDVGNYPEDVVCNISANSHDIIHNIVENYFNSGGVE